MTTFLDLVRAQGFETINDYLEAMPEFPAQNDISAKQLEKIRQNEALTVEYLEVIAC